MVSRPISSFHCLYCIHRTLIWFSPYPVSSHCHAVATEKYYCIPRLFSCSIFVVVVVVRIILLHTPNYLWLIVAWYRHRLPYHSRHISNDAIRSLVSPFPVQNTIILILCFESTWNYHITANTPFPPSKQILYSFS